MIISYRPNLKHNADWLIVPKWDYTFTKYLL